MSFDPVSYAMGKAKGSGGGKSFAPMTETTYAALKALRDSGQLVPGMQYRITDYVTTVNGRYDLSEMAGGTPTYVHYARSAGHPFDLIVTALDAATLDEHATATRHAGDTYFANSAPELWDVKYTLDNDPTKYAWADAANGRGVITFLRDEFNNEAGYDFKNVQILAYALKMADPEAEPDSLCYGYEEPDGEETITHYQRFGSVFRVFNALAAYMQAGSYVNPFERSGHDFACGANILGTAQFATVDETYLTAFQAGWYYTFDHCEDGSTHSDYSLNPGKTMCFENRIAMCQDALASYLRMPLIPTGINSTIFEDDRGAYCGENDLEANAFLNIFGNNCLNNKLGFSSYSNTFGDNCYSNTFGVSCNSNTFGDNCYSNTFGVSCNSNTFGDNCDSNTFGNDCDSNTFGDNCYSNTFGDNCGSNTFGDNCYSNTFGDYCNSNTFGNDCDSNTFGDNCNSNTFGDNCGSNTFGDNCYSNTFGNSCNSNTFGATDQNNELRGNIQGLHVDFGIRQITIAEGDLDPTASYSVEAYECGSGNWPTASRAVLVKKYHGVHSAQYTIDGGSTWTPVP